MRPGGIGWPAAVRPIASTTVTILSSNSLADGWPRVVSSTPRIVSAAAAKAAMAARWRCSASQARTSSGVIRSAPGPDAALRGQRAHRARRRRRVERVAIDRARQPIAGGEQQIEERRGDAQAGLDAPAPGELGGCGRCHGRGLYG